MAERINQIEPWYDEHEAEAVAELFATNSWLTEFRKTRELEKMICEYTGAKYCTAVCNGTMGLMVSLMACGIGKGDKVIVPAYTMPATAYAVSLVGAEPIFVDIDRTNLCIDTHMPQHVIDGQAKAIIHVSINGRNGRVAAIRAIADAFNIFLVEDACQAVGSWYAGKHLGTFGDIGVLSLNAFKIISMGQGGVILTDDEDLYDKCKSIKDFGRGGGRGSQYEILGMNAKVTDLQSVVGIEQMKKLPDRAKKKKQLWRWYYDMLYDVAGLDFIDTDLEECSPWFIDILCENRDGLMGYLDGEGIEAQPFYPPLHKLPYYQKLLASKIPPPLKGIGMDEFSYFYPNATYVSEHGLWLPSSSFLVRSQVEYICEKIGGFYNGHIK